MIVSNYYVRLHNISVVLLYTNSICNVRWFSHEKDAVCFSFRIKASARLASRLLEALSTAMAAEEATKTQSQGEFILYTTLRIIGVLASVYFFLTLGWLKRLRRDFDLRNRKVSSRRKCRYCSSLSKASHPFWIPGRLEPLMARVPEGDQNFNSPQHIAKFTPSRRRRHEAPQL